MEKLNSPENLQTNFDDFVKKHKKLIRRFIKKKYQDPLSTAMINAFLKDKKCKYVLDENVDDFDVDFDRGVVLIPLNWFVKLSENLQNDFEKFKDKYKDMLCRFI